jgi:4-oxalocrotonate tautomerase
MPLIQVTLIEGVFTAPQKQEIIERLTDAMVAIEGEAMRSVTWCLVEEVASGEWAWRPGHHRRRRRSRGGARHDRRRTPHLTNRTRVEAPRVELWRRTTIPIRTSQWPSPADANNQVTHEQVFQDSSTDRHLAAVALAAPTGAGAMSPRP